MRLIVDSGSTKTDWIAIDDSGAIIFETFTLGLNPQVLTEYIIEERIINNYDCDDCGHITVRNGSCYKCLNCGNSLGCS